MEIKELIIYSKDIQSQIEFYKNTMNLRILQQDIKKVSFRLKNSILTFIENKAFTPYHFAFTIPTDKIVESLDWLKERVSIIEDKQQEIVDFPAWNAESIYFYDAEKNIVEFIMRKNLDNSTKGPFTSDDILEISEIGLATADFEEKFDYLTSFAGIEKFSGGKDVFSAIGSERGLIILIDKNKKDWIPNNDTAYASEFTASVKTEENSYLIKFKDDTLIIA